MPPQHTADEVSYRLLIQGEAFFRTLQYIVSALDTSGLSGRSVLNADGRIARAFAAAAFVYGGAAGLHCSFHTYPSPVPSCAAQSQVPGLRFPSMSFSATVSATMLICKVPYLCLSSQVGSFGWKMPMGR